MIRMLEGMLVVSISQQLLNMAKVFLHSKVKLDYHLPYMFAYGVLYLQTYTWAHPVMFLLIVFLLKQALIRWQADIFGQP